MLPLLEGTHKLLFIPSRPEYISVLSLTWLMGKDLFPWTDEMAANFRHRSNGHVVLAR